MFVESQAHPAARLFINKPIENYKGLRIICGEDNATGHMRLLCSQNSGKDLKMRTTTTTEMLNPPEA